MLIDLSYLVDKVPNEILKICAEEDTLHQLSTILQRANNEIAGDDSMLWILSQDENTLYPIATVNTDIALLDKISVPVQDSVIGMVVSTGLSTTIGPDDEYNPEVEKITGIETSTMVAVPIYVDGKEFGVLSSIRSDKENIYAAKELRLYEWYAYVLSLVIERELYCARAKTK